MKTVYRFQLQQADGVVIREYPYKEVQSLATCLGMDLEADAEVEWFLRQALITLLPSGWKRESDPRGRIQYHNAQTQATTGTHPLLYQYRYAFFRLLQRRPHPDDPEAQQHLFRDLLKEPKTDGPERFAALKDADQFYASIVRLTEGRPPRFIEESAEYQQASPQAVLEMARKLGIINEFRLFWVARMALALPLPPCFEFTLDELGATQYLNTEYGVLLEMHPCVLFLQKQLVLLRGFQAPRTSDLMFFYDKDFMPYVVDLQSLARGEPQSRISLDAKGLTKMRKGLFKGERDMREVIYDMMLLELAKCAQVEASEVHLYGAVAEFMEELREEGLFEKWRFRYTLEGERYWFHTPEERAYRQFPYAKALRRLVKRRRKRGVNKHPSYLRPPLLRHQLFTQYGEDLYYPVRTEALDLMTSVLRTMLETNVFRMPEEEIDVSESLKSLEKKLDKEQALDLLFACPYDLALPALKPKIRHDLSDVSTDSEIMRESGFKLQGDKLIFVPAEPMERSGAFRKANLMKTRIVPRRREGPLSNLKPEALLPFQVQIGRVLRALRTGRDPPKPEVVSSADSLSSEEEEPVSLPAQPNAPLQRAKTQFILLDNSPQLTEAKSESESEESRSSAEDQPKKAVSVVAVQEVTHKKTSKTHRVAFETVDTVEEQTKLAVPKTEPRDSKVLLEVVGTAKEKNSSRAATETEKKVQGLEVPSIGTSPRLSATRIRTSARLKSKELPPTAAEKLTANSPERVTQVENAEIVQTEEVWQRSESRETKPEYLSKNTPAGKGSTPIDTAPSTSHRNRLSPPLYSSPRTLHTASQPLRFSQRHGISTAVTGNQPFQRINRGRYQYLSPTAPVSPRSPLPTLSDRTIYRTTAQLETLDTEPSQNRQGLATSIGSKRGSQIKRSILKLPGEGLPEDFVLSPRATTSTAAMRSEGSQPMQMRYFLHYLKMVGFPLSTQAELRQFPAPADVQPKQVVLMGRRLGLRVSVAKLASVESDLLWIPLLQLACPLPSPCDAPVTAAQQVLLPLGKHPGDEFFRLLTGFNRKHRVQELANMSKENRVASMIGESWLQLTQRNQTYCYNFLTGARMRVPSQQTAEVTEKDPRAEYMQQFLESRTALNLAPLLER